MADNPMYKAILKWSLSQTDGTRTSEATEMDQEKREFLDKVMSSMVEDESKTMKELVATLSDPEDTLEQVKAKESALEELIDRSDRIDYAVALHSFGNGLFPTIDLIASSKHGSIRSLAAELVALCVKDNPPCQAWAFERNALNVLLGLHSGRTGNTDDAVGETERVKALSAISALIQHNDDAVKAFLWAGGLDNMKQDLHMQVGQRLRARACFVLQWLFESSQNACKQAVEKQFAPLLFLILLQSEEIEYAGRALRSLAKKDAIQCAEQIRAADREWQMKMNDKYGCNDRMHVSDVVKVEGIITK